ncbi:hypothetical protein ACPV4A_01105 [Vibrio rotiferianus]|uniref:hypothetical protein n=1 Tax=Vibrio rotiferianus TaxID=190895 RepID=UPI00406A20C6
MDIFSLGQGNEVLSSILAISLFYLGATVIGGGLYKCGMFRDIHDLPTKAKRLGRALAVFAGFTLMLSGLGKVVGLDPMVAKFTQFNMLHLFKFTGCTEIITGLLLIFPRTCKIGLLMGIALCGGAIATHLPTHSDGPIWAIPSGSVMVFLWASAFFYTPEFYPEWFTKWVHKQILPKSLHNHHVA